MKIHQAPAGHCAVRVCADRSVAAVAGDGDSCAREAGQPRDLLSGASRKDEKIFKLHKFRSMSDARDETGSLLPDKERLTGFGKKLRALSIDELPELWDIFRGKMSIVGPRPLLVEYLPYYSEDERHRHDVRPGLTGLAQINGRNTLTWEQKFAYDLEYVQRISFCEDIKILFRTVGKVLNRSGVQVNTQSGEGNLAKIRSCVCEKAE